MRRNLPKRKTRGSFLIVNFMFGRSETCIVRNLKIMNSLPLYPIRFWRNKTGPGPEKRMPTAHASRTGAMSARRNKAASLSTTLLTSSDIRLIGYSDNSSKLSPGNTWLPRQARPNGSRAMGPGIR